MKLTEWATSVDRKGFNTLRLLAFVQSTTAEGDDGARSRIAEQRGEQSRNA